MNRLIAGIVDFSENADGARFETRIMDACKSMNFNGLEFDFEVSSLGAACFGYVDINPKGDVISAISKDPNTGRMSVADLYIYATEQTVEKNSKTGFRALTESASNLDYANADFALAQWDQENRMLTLARDAFGVRPLFWQRLEDHLIAFASLPTGLLTLSGRVSVAEDAFAKSLAGDAGPIFEGHVPAAAGRRVTFRAVDEIEEQQFFALENLPNARPVPDFNDAAETAAELLRKAVQMRLSKTGRTASHLSSGLDSGAVSVTAKRALEEDEKRLVALTLTDPFFDPAINKRDESSAVRNLIQREGGMDHLTAPLSNDAPHAVHAASLFEYQCDAGEVALQDDARLRGADVILSGLGGDQFLSAPNPYAALELLKAGRLGALAKLLAGLKSARGWQPWRVVLAAIKERSRLSASRQAAVFASFVEPALSQTLVKYLLGVPPSKARVRREWDWANGGVERELLRYAHLGAAGGVRYAFPLLDRDLVAYVHGLPTEFFAREGHNRALMRASTEGLLPDETRFQANKASPAIAPMSKLARTAAQSATQCADPDFIALAEHFGVKADALRKVFEAAPDVDRAREMDRNNEWDTALTAAAQVFEALDAMRLLLSDTRINLPKDRANE